MTKLFSFNLAFNNIKKHSKIIIPYIITCIVNIAMFYNMYALTFNDRVSGSTKSVLFLGVIVIAVFSLIFTFYTNSFLIKQRLGEFGLYNVLGMEKKHISKILFFEIVINGAISIIFGIISGVLFNKLFSMALLKMTGLTVQYNFIISYNGIFYTILLFTFIYLLNFLNGVRLIYSFNPIELLKSSQKGEKEPKINWFNLISGSICIMIAYYISITIKYPLAAITYFFIAVILVIIGTHQLFMAGSIALLKLLKSNKQFYYRIDNFTSVSSLMYRMKQNAAGLANICILSTMVLVIISSTVCLYIGLEDSLNTRYPRDFEVISSVDSYDDVTDIKSELNDILSNKQINIFNESVSLEAILPISLNDNIVSINNEGFSVILFVVDINSYNSFYNTDIELKDNEILYYHKGNKNYDSFIFNNEEIFVKNKLDEIYVSKEMDRYLSDSYTFVVNDIFSFSKKYDINFNYDFDANLSIEDNTALVDYIDQEFSKYDVSVNSRESDRASFMEMNGTFFFLGIFLGIVFIIATVLIIYYKQLQEGYEDKKRFEIMKKVGMDDRTIKASINRQVLIIFFLPLVVAIIHIWAAFNVISKLLLLVGVYNISLFAICLIGTIVVFSIVYIIVYYSTARVYYHIVEGK